jgi:glycosyltransferase involved in cell wall biosynthesis
MYSDWDSWSRRQVSRTIRRIQPDLVQTYMGRATRLTRLADEGIVHVARLGGYYDPKRYRHAHAWITVTKGVRDAMLTQGFPAAKVFQIYNFIEPPAPASATTPLAVSLPADAWMLLSAGRLVPVKGIEYLLTAFARLPASIGGRPLHLVVLGDGPLRGSLTELARRLDIAQRVHWPGWQTSVGAYYRRADLVVFPSLPQEALGNVVLEAWNYGKPVLASEYQGAREFCRHGHDTWLVPCADAVSLAEGMRILLNDGGLCEELAAAGQRKVRRDFSKKAIVEQYQSLYQRLIAH